MRQQLDKIWYGFESTASLAEVYGISRRYMLDLLKQWHKDEFLEKLKATCGHLVIDLWKLRYSKVHWDEL